MSSAKHWEFSFLFSSLDSIIFASSQIAVSRTSKTMLNNNSQSGHFCLVSDLRRNVFRLSPLRTMSPVCLHDLYYIQVGSFYAGFLESFYHKWVQNFVERFYYIYQSVRSVAQSCPTLCDPMDCSTPGFPVHHKFPELAQTHIHWVSDVMQPSHPLLSPSPPGFNLSQHQGLFQWVNSSHEVTEVLELQLQHQSFQWIFRTDLL